jgi:hypothetical protein
MTPRFVEEVARSNAEIELKFLNSNTIFKHILGVQTIAGLPQITELIQEGLLSSNSSSDVQVLLRKQAAVGQFHFLTLLN